MIRVEDTELLRVITLDRPGRANALTLEALTTLRQTIEGSEASVVYLHGAGQPFCGGADLDTVRDVAGDRDAARTLARTGQQTMDTIESSDTVVVAGVDGAARGGGVELALACDLRVATPEATFAEPGVELGIFGAWGGTRRLPRIVGEGQALDIALSGRVLDAETAHRMGLVSRVTPTPERVATTIAGHDPDALGVVKQLVRRDRDRDQTNEAEADAFTELAPASDLDR